MIHIKKAKRMGGENDNHILLLGRNEGGGEQDDFADAQVKRSSGGGLHSEPA